MRAGIYTDITADDYHADPCDAPSLSASIAHILTREGGSPADAYLAHPKLGGMGTVPTKAMDRGSLMHALLLGEPENVGVIDVQHSKTGEACTDYRTKSAKTQREQVRQSGKIPVLVGEYLEAKALAQATNSKFLDKGLDLSKGHREVTLVWNERADDGTIVKCRGRVDHLYEPAINDLKMSDKVSEVAIQRKMLEFGYHVQHAAYVSAVETLLPNLAGRTEFVFWFFQTEGLCKVQGAEPDGTMRELGRALWRRAINTWARCIRTGEWPDGTQDRKRISAPIYALRQEFGAEASEM